MARIATVTTSTRSTGSRTSRDNPTRIRATAPVAPVAAVSVASSGGRVDLIVLTVSAAPTKQAADRANGDQGARTNSTPAASGPARSRARVSTVTKRALARSR